MTTSTSSSSGGGGGLPAVPCGQLTGAATGAVFELGHAIGVGKLRQANGRVLSRDGTGRWVLWDVATKALVASGEPLVESCMAPFTCPADDIEMAGNIFLVHVAGAVELRDAGDGHLILNVPIEAPVNLGNWTFPPFGLAADGSYLWVGSHINLRAWSAAGALLFTRSGDYFTGMVNIDPKPPVVYVVAEPAEIRIGRSTTHVIEYVDSSTGASTMSAAFADTFNSWFLDGGRFFTNLSTTVRIYSKDVVQEALVALPSIQSLAGQGGYFWTTNGIYQVAQPAAPPQALPGGALTPIGNLIAVPDVQINSQATQITIVHLDPGGITTETVAVPFASASVFAADGSGNWSVSAADGVVLDSVNLLAHKGPLSCGKAFAIAGADTGLAAVGTPGGGVLTFHGSGAALALQGAVPVRGEQIQASADGTVLAINSGHAYGFWPDETTRLFSMPSAVEIHEWPLLYNQGTAKSLARMALARGGTMLGQITDVAKFGTHTYSRSVTDLTGSTTSFMDQVMVPISSPPPFPAIYLSPDGTLVAAIDASGTATQIYKNGALVDVTSGVAAGWIDDDRLLLDGTKIHSLAAAMNVASVALPCTTKGFGVVDANHVYCPSTNTIYDLTSSAAVWTGSASGLGIGAIAGGYAVYAKDHHIYAEAYSFP